MEKVTADSPDYPHGAAASGDHRNLHAIWPRLCRLHGRQL